MWFRFGRLSFICGSILLTALVADADDLRFGTAPAEATWSFTGDRSECRLTQTVPDYGEAILRQEAGLGTVFSLTAPEPWFSPGAIETTSTTPEWHPGFPGTRALDAVTADASGVVSIGEPVASTLLVDLYDGREIVFRQKGVDGRPGVVVGVSGVNFRPLYSRFAVCTAALLPATFERVARSSLAFAANDFTLDGEAKARLDLVAAYLRADPDVKAVYIDGHTDGGKAGEADLDLSRRRAEVVEDYFVERRIPKDRLVVRYHADRYPIAPNTTAEGRAKNRRATIRLDYEPAKSAVARR
jgi:outer membrane protein OmpA-like peptidoglycan-associated protein